MYIPGCRGDGVSLPMLVCSACSPKTKSDSIEAESIPHGMELVGLSFASVGATDPPKSVCTEAQPTRVIGIPVRRWTSPRPCMTQVCPPSFFWGTVIFPSRLCGHLILLLGCLPIAFCPANLVLCYCLWMQSRTPNLDRTARRGVYVSAAALQQRCNVSSPISLPDDTPQ